MAFFIFYFHGYVNINREKCIYFIVFHGFVYEYREFYLLLISGNWLASLRDPKDYRWPLRPALSVAEVSVEGVPV